MTATKIEWTDSTWNPFRGCRKISAGCKHCYAETFAERFRGVEGHAYEQGFDPRFVPEQLERPLRWRKPRRIFVNSMSDLFLDDFTNEQIAAVFGVMAAAPQHQFQILTKRARRMREWFEWVHTDNRGHEFAEPGKLHVALCNAMQSQGDWDPDDRHCEELCDNAAEWPLRNVWLGVSAEDQQRADERIPYLLACPAAVRFVSVEPMLGPINLTRLSWGNGSNRLDWVICGGESGPGARLFDFAHARALRAQCQVAGVAFFMKQGGAVALDTDNSGLAPLNLRDRKGGDMSEFPADLRVREFPA